MCNDYSFTKEAAWPPLISSPLSYHPLVILHRSQHLKMRLQLRGSSIGALHIYPCWDVHRGAYANKDIGQSVIQVSNIAMRDFHVCPRFWRGSSDCCCLPFPCSICFPWILRYQIERMFRGSAIQCTTLDQSIDVEKSLHQVFIFEI